MSATHHAKKFFHVPLALSALSVLSLAPMGAFAQSSMSLYGALDLSVGSFQYAGVEGGGDNTRLTKVDGNQMVTSYIGFKGTEDLGGGLKAGFVIESFLRPDTGAAGRADANTTTGAPADNFWGRAANVWLQSGLGKLTLGRQANVLFLQVAGYNPLGGAFGLSPAVRLTYGKWGNDRGDSSWSNAVGYTSPTMSGLTFNAQAQTGESATKAERSSYALGLAYTAGPFSASLGWQMVRSAEAPKLPTAAGARQTFGLGSVSYDAGFAKFFGQYGQFEDHGFGTGTLFTSLGQLGATVSVGASGKLLTSIGQSKEKPIENGTGVANRHTIVTIAYDHWLSKRTDVYVAVMNDKENRSSGTQWKSGVSYAVGMRHSF